MLHRLLAMTLVLSWGTTAPAAAPALPKTSDVLAKLNDLYRGKSSHARMKMRVVTKHYTRELTMESWSRGKDNAVIVIRAPAREAGTATLRTPEGLWNYVPRADRLLRLPSGMLSESWMGSHFTNDDLVRESDYLKDFTVSLAWQEDAGSHELQATLIPKPDAPVVYTKLVYRLSANDWLPLSARFYDDEEVVRTFTFRDVKTFSGRKLPTVLEIVPADKPHESTVVTYELIEFDVAIDDSLFTQRGLRRAAKRR